MQTLTFKAPSSTLPGINHMSFVLTDGVNVYKNTVNSCHVNKKSILLE